MLFKENKMDEATQKAVDNMVSGYINMFTPYESKVNEPGEVFIQGKTASFVVDTVTDEEKLILKITDNEDPYHPIEEDPQDLESITERLTELHKLEG